MGNTLTKLTTCVIKMHPTEPGDEHIIPSVLGGRLRMPEVCRECNNVECSHLDQILARDFFLLRARLRYRTPHWEDAEKMLYDNAKFGEIGRASCRERV